MAVIRVLEDPAKRTITKPAGKPAMNPITAHKTSVFYPQPVGEPAS
ncbi:hypothetical protein [Ferrimonas sediminum]|nr:hypothetical protein [Ferrimonas sediminum]